MTSLAITIRTVDSVPSWPALGGPWSENWVNPLSDAPDKCKVCEASGISVDHSTRRSGGVSIQYRPRVRAVVRNRMRRAW